MSEILRSRDCIIFYKGDSTTVTVSSAMVASGWAGGQGVQWVGIVGDDRIVTYSQGLFGGFMFWGSNEQGDDYTAITRQQTVYRYATMFFGGCLIATSSYESYTYASRIGGGPLVPLVYQPNDQLYFSLRGLWTKQDEMTISGNSAAPAAGVGYVAQLPKSANRNYLGIQVSM
jgi:hypothetical protein